MERLTHYPEPPASRPNRRSCLSWAFRMAILLTVLLLCALGIGMVYLQTQRFEGPSTVVIGGEEATVEPSDQLNPAERAYLRGYLTLHAAEIEDPVGGDSAPIRFTIEAGESGASISDRLEVAGLIADATLFRYYLRYYDLDASLEAGEFDLTRNMAIPEIAQALSNALADEIEIRITEGWRLEQTADYLRANPQLGIDPDQFLLLARRSGPPAEGGTSSSESLGFLTNLPPGASLEGYLFPDTYRLPADAAAQDLVSTMLFTFSQRMTGEMAQLAAERGLSLHDVITIASIVEREAQLPQERAIIASVFLNRLGQSMMFEADPTVQYALGYQETTGQWWKRPLTYEDLDIDSPYNTYRYAGLPPGPIAGPSLASIQAVVYPAETDYLFFVVDCTADNPGAHAFAVTYEEHVANVNRCQ